MEDIQSAAPSPSPAPPQDVDTLFPEKSGGAADVDSLFPASVEADRKAKASGISHSPVNDLIFGDKTVNPVARVLDSFGQGFEQGWGTDQLGLSPESTDYLKKIGIFNDYHKGQASLIKTANEVLIRPAATALEAAWRTMQGGFRGGQAVVQQLGAEVGAPGLGREIAALPEAFPTGLHGPISGMPIPGLGLSEAVRNSPGLIETARQMRVIGAGERGWAGTGLVEAPKGEPVKVETSPHPVAGAPEQPQATAPPRPSVPLPAENITPDIHAAAREAAPDVFARYDELTEQQTNLRNWIAEQEQAGETAPVATARLDDVTKQINDLSPQVAEAYRNAAAVTNTATVRPPVSQSWGMFPPPEVSGVPAKIDATHTVLSGANSTADGTVVVDRNIPEFSPTLKDKDGNPANLHKYLAVHETVEADAMKRGMSYDDAHTKVATPAERAAVEADGVDWNAYTKEMDGYLDHIEHEPNTNPPPGQMHIDPEDAIGHHKSENKATPTPQAPIVQFRKDAAGIERQLPPVQEGTTRLWRADRPGQTGTAFTNDLPGLALPFHAAYKGNLSYVDVSTADLAKYENIAGTAHNAEFALPPEIASTAKVVPRPIEAQRDFIVNDVKRQLIAAGRPEAEAQAAGQLVAARYEARAARLGGARGSAEELYKAEGAQIRGPGRPAAPAPTGTPAIAPTPAAEAPVWYHGSPDPFEGELNPDRTSALHGPALFFANERGIARHFTDESAGIDPHIIEANLAHKKSIEENWRGAVFNSDAVRKSILEAKKAGNEVLYLRNIRDYEGGPIHDQAAVIDPKIITNIRRESLKEPETIHVGPKAARGPRAVPQERWSLLQFIADRGGIKADDKHIGDVRTIFGKDQKWIPGFGPLIRKDGMELDRAREAAVEAGYIQDHGQSGVSAGEATSNLDTLLQAMDREERGTKVYRQGIEPAEARERVPDVAELEQHRAIQAELDTRIADYLKEIGLKPNEIEPFIAARMRELMDRQRLEPDIAHERAVMEADDHAVETENAPERAEYIPGWDVPDDTGAAQAAREATPKGEEAAPGARTRTDRDGDREKAWTEFYQRKREHDLITEREAEGQQQIPGAERISDAERAQRAADQPLKPKAEQKPMDEGLFGDAMNQRELFQRPYEGLPDSLMGFRRYGPSKGFTESKFPHVQYVRVTLADGSNFVDAIKGLNEKHALERAYRNWDAERIDPLTEAEAVKEVPEIKELAQQARGGIVLNPNAVPGHDYIGMENVRPLMRLTAEANASTFFHESGHHWLAELVRDAAHEAAPADLKADAQTVMDWLGLKGPQDLALGSDASRAAKIKATKAHEKFARGFEQYLREGTAPSPQLAGVFAKVKQWMLNIYQTIKGLGAPITDDIRGVFDRMLAEQPQRTVIAPEIAKRPDLQDIHESDAVLTEPHEAERAGDRVQAEDARARAELPKDIADEHRGSAEKIGTSPSEPIPLGENRGRPDTIGAGGAGGAELGTEPQGGSHIVPQGAGLRTREGGAGTIEPLPIGPHVPLDALPAAKMDKVGNIRLENLNTPADVNNAIRDLYRANRDQLDAATRGVVSDQTVMDLADAMGTDPRVVANNMDRLRQMSVEDGVPLAARIWLMRDMFTKLSAEVANLAKGDDVAAFASARQRFLMAFETLSGVTAEMGRGMRAFRNMKTQMASAIEMANILKDDPKTLFQLKQQMALARAAETPAQSAAEIQRANRTPWQRVRAGVISYVINNLISGPITHVMYSVGNDVLQLFKALPETAAASLAGRVLVATGKISEEDRIRMGEAGPRLYGMVYGARDGLSASYSALKTGVSVMKGDPSGIDLFSNEIAYRPQEIPGTFGYVMETPSRSVAAIHTMHYGMNYESEIAALGYRDAIKQGFDPGTDEFNAHVANFRMNPPRDAMDIAHTTALEQVLMRRPPYGGLQNWIQNLTNKYMIAKLVAPFVQIGGNILRGGFIERTPLGLMDQAVRDNLRGINGPFKQQEQYGKIMVGSTLAVSTLGLAAQGIITGGGPSDPKQREVMEMTGWKPYSIKVEGEYIPYRKYLSVYGPLVAGAADMYEVGHAMSEKGLAQGAAALSFGFAEVVADETWMRGITSLIDTARHWDRDGAKYMRNLSTEFIPFSIGMRQIASLTDPVWRSVRSEMDALRAHIPGMSQSLFPVRDLWGQPMRGGSMMSWSPAVNDPATIALQKAEYYPARPERKIRGVELTDQQYDDFTRIAGRDAKMRINAMISNPGFDLIPKQIRQEQLKSAMDGGREMARTVILMQYPEIMKQALATKQLPLQSTVVH